MPRTAYLLRSIVDWPGRMATDGRRNLVRRSSPPSKFSNVYGSAAESSGGEMHSGSVSERVAQGPFRAASLFAAILTLSQRGHATGSLIYSRSDSGMRELAHFRFRRVQFNGPNLFTPEKEKPILKRSERPGNSKWSMDFLWARRWGGHRRCRSPSSRQLKTKAKNSLTPFGISRSVSGSATR